MGRNLTLKITFSAVAAALTFVATVFIQVPSVDGGYTNLSDAIIFLTAALLGPVPAMLAGGLGTFFADLYVYPATMFYSLVIHGLEGLFCGLLLKLIHSKCRNSKLEPLLGGAAMALCGLFMAGMYFLAKWLFYGTWASALVSLPRNLIQAGLSVVLAVVAVYIVKLPSLLKKQGVNVERIKRRQRTFLLKTGKYPQPVIRTDNETNQNGEIVNIQIKKARLLSRFLFLS